jgi:hypothetical protein
MEKEVRSREEFHLIIGTFFIILVVFMFFLALKNQTSLPNIIIGFLPTIIYLGINYELLFHLKHKRFLVFILPLCLSILFYIAASLTALTIVAQMDIPTIIFLNLLISYVFGGIILYVLYMTKELKAERQYVREVRREVLREFAPQYLPQKTTLKESINSLEDKCKAINYAIGRVYSDKHGGSKTIRERLAINKEWYNKFSELRGDYSERDKELIKVSIDLIKKRISLYEHKEKDVIAQEHLKNIERDPQGNSTISQVLINNDKDPVESYIKGALDACTAILQELGQYQERHSESQPFIDIGSNIS